MNFAEETQTVLECIPTTIKLLAYDGTLWITYPKATASLKDNMNLESPGMR